MDFGRFRPLASGVAFSDGRMIVKLVDGRELSVPLDCFPGWNALQRVNARGGSWLGAVLAFTGL